MGKDCETDMVFVFLDWASEDIMNTSALAQDMAQGRRSSLVYTDVYRGLRILVIPKGSALWNYENTKVQTGAIADTRS